MFTTSKSTKSWTSEEDTVASYHSQNHNQLSADLTAQQLHNTLASCTIIDIFQFHLDWPICFVLHILTNQMTSNQVIFKCLLTKTSSRKIHQLYWNCIPQTATNIKLKYIHWWDFFVWVTLACYLVCVKKMCCVSSEHKKCHLEHFRFIVPEKGNIWDGKQLITYFSKYFTMWYLGHSNVVVFLFWCIFRVKMDERHKANTFIQWIIGWAAFQIYWIMDPRFGSCHNQVQVPNSIHYTVWTAFLWQIVFVKKIVQ